MKSRKALSMAQERAMEHRPKRGCLRTQERYLKKMVNQRKNQRERVEEIQLRTRVQVFSVVHNEKWLRRKQQLQQER